MSSLLGRSYTIKMNKAMNSKDEKNTYRAVLNLVEDTSLVWFLQEKYPKVWEAYCKFKAGDKTDTLDSVLDKIGGKK